MRIHSVDEELFSRYGRVIHNYPTADLLKALSCTPIPEKGTIYKGKEPTLEKEAVAELFKKNIYGGMPIQLGYCNGFNTKLNCLEYHRDSEINLGVKDFILLLAKREDIKSGKIDSSSVVAFKVKANTLVEIYATTLHYAPAQADIDEGFQVLVVLPEGTNNPKEDIDIIDCEDKYLFAKNKWLLAHKDSVEAKDGAVISITGENIDIESDIVR